MTEIQSIGVQTPVTKRKITKGPEIADEVIRIIGDCLKSNPNATDDQLRAEIRNSLQGRVSPKNLAQASSDTVLSGIRQGLQSVSAPPVSTTSSRIPVEQLSSSSIRAKYMPIEQKAANYYHNELPTTKKGWQNRHNKNLQEVKSAFGNDQQYLEYLQRVSPQTYQEEMALRAQQLPKESNNAGKKQANAEYVSSKKRKQQKKTNEAASHAEHKKQQPIKNKSTRNAMYVTEQGQMTTEARKAYNRAEEASRRASESAFRNEISRQEQSVLHTPKSARESFDVFAENGFCNETSSPRRPKSKRRSSGGYYSSESYSSSTGAATSVGSGTKVEIKPDSLKPKVEEAIKPNPSKPGNGGGGKGKYWLFAAIATGLGMIGYGIYSHIKNKNAKNCA